MMVDVPQSPSLPVNLICEFKREVNMRLVVFEQHGRRVEEMNGRKTAPLALHPQARGAEVAIGTRHNAITCAYPPMLMWVRRR